MRTVDMKCRANPATLRAFVIRALSFAAVAALTLNPALTPVFASDYRVAGAVAADGKMNARFLSLGIGKSVVIDLPRDIKDVLVADPKIANAVVRSAQRAYIIGAAVGQTNIVFFDSAGQQIAAYDIAVKRDLNGVRAALKQILPECRHQDRRPRRRRHPDRLGGEPGGSAAGGRSRCAPRRRRRQGRQQHRGPRPRPGHAEGHGRRSRAHHHQAAWRRSQRQPELRHRGGELQQRQPVHGSRQHAGRRQRPDGSKFGATPSVQATLRAMESAGVVRTLAEPNLTAISGESATFIAGGEFPVPAGYACDPTTHVCTTQISFKKFGISLNFTPVVLSEGRISLRVMTEVSELSNENAITLSQAVTSTRQLADGALDQDPPRRNHAGNSLRRLDGDGRPDPAADQAGDQRIAGPDAAAGPRHAVPQPRLRQQRRPS